jgi:hypothetical protein
MRRLTARASRPGTPCAAASPGGAKRPRAVARSAAAPAGWRGPRRAPRPTPSTRWPGLPSHATDRHRPPLAAPRVPVPDGRRPTGPPGAGAGQPVRGATRVAPQAGRPVRVGSPGQPPGVGPQRRPPGVGPQRRGPEVGPQRRGPGVGLRRRVPPGGMPSGRRASRLRFPPHATTARPDGATPQAVPPPRARVDGRRVVGQRAYRRRGPGRRALGLVVAGAWRAARPSVAAGAWRAARPSVAAGAWRAARPAVVDPAAVGVAEVGVGGRAPARGDRTPVDRRAVRTDSTDAAARGSSACSAPSWSPSA